MAGLRTALALALAILIVPAGLALAGGSGDATVQVTEITNLPDAELEAEVVTCPIGQRIVGGGAGGAANLGEDDTDTAFSGPVDDTQETAQTETGDVAVGWLVGVLNQSNDPADHKLFAVCSTTSDATVKVRNLELDTGETGGAQAKCPAGTRAVGGGIGTTGVVDTFNYFVQLSGPLDGTGKTKETKDGDVARRWFGSITNASGDDAVDFRVFALCSAASNARIEAKAVKNVRDDGYGEAVVNCPGSKRATGGGIGSIKPAGSANVYDMPASGPVGPAGNPLGTNDGDKPKAWYAAVDNDQGATRDFRAFAICE